MAQILKFADSLGSLILSQSGEVVLERSRRLDKEVGEIDNLRAPSSLQSHDGSVAAEVRIFHFLKNNFG